MIRLAALLLVLLAVPASAKDITLTLTDEEQKALMTILDQAIRQGGLQSVPPVWKFVNKLQTAVNPGPPVAQNMPPKPEPEK